MKTLKIILITSGVFIILNILLNGLFILCGPYETYGPVGANIGWHYPCGSLSRYLLSLNISIFSSGYIFAVFVISLLIASIFVVKRK